MVGRALTVVGLEFNAYLELVEPATRLQAVVYLLIHLWPISYVAEQAPDLNHAKEVLSKNSELRYVVYLELAVRRYEFGLDW